MAYATASMKYKVVATHITSCYSSIYSLLVQCNALTVGVNTWRLIGTQQLSPKANELLCHDPLITEGFMHWTSSFENVVLTLNVETEVFAETPVPLAPLEYQDGGRKYHYLSTGRHLSVLHYLQY